MLGLLTDSMFHAPLLAGLLAAAALGLLAAPTGIREEWLAAYALAQCAAAGVVVVLALNLAPLLGAVLGALTGVLFKGLLIKIDNRAYAYLWLGAWTLGLLIAANSHAGEALAHALVEGQLYFTRWPQVGMNGVFLLVLLFLWPRLAATWLRERLLPGTMPTPARTQALQRLILDLLLAAGVALGTATFGVMATFGLLFLPAGAALCAAQSWHQAQILTIALAVSGYLVAFILALAADQPFTPVLLAVLLVLAGGMSRVCQQK